MISRSGLASVFSLTAIALVMPVAGAQAFELQQFGDRLKALWVEQGTTLDWAEITGDESEVVIKGLKGEISGMPKPLEMGDVTFSDIDEKDDHYLIGTVEVGDYELTEQGATIKATGIEAKGVQLPFTAAGTAGVSAYDSATIETLTVDVDNKELFKVEDISSSAKESSDGVFDITFLADKFTSELAEIADPKTKAILSEIGYETITGKMDMEGSWNMADGRMAVTKNDFIIDDAGTLGITFDISGYTPAFLKSLQETTEKMADATPEQQQAQGMAMLGLMQQLTFTGASIRFDDDSLTEKVIETIAKQQNTTPEALINQAKAIVPFGLAQLNMPEFAQSVSNAVNAFLDDPQSLQITAKPAQPLPFAQIAATGMMASGPDAPKAIINQLGVTVTAND